MGYQALVEIKDLCEFGRHHWVGRHGVSLCGTVPRVGWGRPGVLGDGVTCRRCLAEQRRRAKAGRPIEIEYPAPLRRGEED